MCNFGENQIQLWNEIPYRHRIFVGFPELSDNITNIIIVSCIDKTSSKLKNKTYVSRLDAWAPRTWLVTGVASKSGQTGHQESGVTLIGNH